jgi:hypothetical protein
MKKQNTTARWAVAAVLSLVTVFSMVTPAGATGTVSKPDLSGPWALSLIGDTGCGMSTMYVTLNLNTAGTGTANITAHTAGCGDTVNNGQTFTVQTLNANGSGTANLSCGPGCGWNLDIQVSPDRTTFTAVDVSSANPGNFIEGVAIHQ